MNSQAPSPKPQAFFPVSTQKFVVLSIATFGIYPIYWFYQNWKRIRDAQAPHKGVPYGKEAPYERKRISPFWRACFAPLWGIALLKCIKRRAEAEQIAVTWNPVPLGIAFFVVSMSAFLPGSWSLLSVGLFAPLLPPIQTTQQINAAAGNPEGVNDSFGAGNIVTIIIGALVWALVLFAMTIRP